MIGILVTAFFLGIPVFALYFALKKPPVFIILLCGFIVIPIIVLKNLYGDYSSKSELIRNYSEKIDDIAVLLREISPEGFDLYRHHDRWGLYDKESRETFYDNDIFTYIDKKKFKELDGLRKKAGIKGLSIRDHYVQLMFKYGYTRHDTYEWGYLIYPAPLTAEEQELIDDGCRHLVYKDNVVLYYWPSTGDADYRCIAE